MVDKLDRDGIRRLTSAISGADGMAGSTLRVKLAGDPGRLLSLKMSELGIEGFGGDERDGQLTIGRSGDVSVTIGGVHKLILRDLADIFVLTEESACALAKLEAERIARKAALLPPACEEPVRFDVDVATHAADQLTDMVADILKRARLPQRKEPVHIISDSAELDKFRGMAHRSDFQRGVFWVDATTHFGIWGERVGRIVENALGKCEDGSILAHLRTTDTSTARKGPYALTTARNRRYLFVLNTGEATRTMQN